jgi:hypothetical protein
MVELHTFERKQDCLHGKNKCYSRGHQCLAVGSGGRKDMNIIFGSYNWRQGIQERGRKLWEWLCSRIWATWNCHSLEVHPFSCSEITFQEMSAAQTFIMQHSCRISQMFLPIPEPCRTYCLKPRNNSSVNNTNMVQVLNFGVMMNKFNVDIG